MKSQPFSRLLFRVTNALEELGNKGRTSEDVDLIALARDVEDLAFKFHDQFDDLDLPVFIPEGLGTYSGEDRSAK